MINYIVKQMKWFHTHEKKTEKKNAFEHVIDFEVYDSK